MKKVIPALPIAAVGVLLTGFLVGSPASQSAAETNASHVAHNHQASAAAGAYEAAVATAQAAGDNGNSDKNIAKSPAHLLALLGERIKAKDVNGIIALHEPEAAIVDWDGSVVRGHKEIRAFYLAWFESNPVLTVNPLQIVEAGGTRGKNGKLNGRSASVMGTYSLEQDAAGGGRESFSGNFCDIVRQQPDGRWLYVQDNPYPPHQ